MDRRNVATHWILDSVKVFSDPVTRSALLPFHLHCQISLKSCVSHFYSTVTKSPDRNDRKEEQFVLAHGFRVSSHNEGSMEELTV